MNMQASLCGLLFMTLACAPAYAQDAEQRLQTVKPVPASRDLRSATSVKTPPANQPLADPGTKVNMETVLKNQLHQCEQDGLALDAQNDELRHQVQTLAQEVDGLQQQNAKLQYKLDETTHPGGSLVTAYCESSNVSHNTAGEVSDCGNYRCEPVSGLCRTVCDVASECRQSSNGIYYVCDSERRQCVPSQ
jgi:hypothetical protein